MYGLNDTSRKFWLRVKDVFTNKLQLKTVEGDEAFYYLNIDGKLHGAIITHIDDFNLAGSGNFIKKVQVKQELTVSKVERDYFGFTGLDVTAVEDGREVSMNDYMQSLKEIKKISRVD